MPEQNKSNLLRAYTFGKVKWLDMSLSFSDVAYLIKECMDRNVKAMLKETLDEAGEELQA